MYAVYCSMIRPRRMTAQRSMRVRELAPQERLQPALLDRLTDDEPDKKVEGQDKRVLTKAQLRQAVLRDLVWLFNTTRLESSEDLSKTPNVRSSVLNFGLPA